MAFAYLVERKSHGNELSFHRRLLYAYHSATPKQRYVDEHFWKEHNVVQQHSPVIMSNINAAFYERIYYFTLRVIKAFKQRRSIIHFLRQ